MAIERLQLIGSKATWLGGVVALLLTTPLSSCTNDPGSTHEVSGAPLALAAVPDLANYRVVPGGHMLHSSCTHEVPSGSTAHSDANGTIHVTTPDGQESVFPPCRYPVVSAHSALSSGDNPDAGANAATPGAEVKPNWVEYSGTNAPTNGGRRWFNGIAGEWVVPSNPAQNGATLFFFNGLVDKLDPNTHTAIIQPVLQYGVAANGGGNYWAIAAWWVGAEAPGGALYTNPIRVNASDTLYGITVAGSGDCDTAGHCSLWAIEACGTSDCSVASTNTILFVSGTNKVYQRAYQGVLEAYMVSSCNQFPNDSYAVFGKTYLYQPPATGSQNQYVEMYNSATWSTPSLNSQWPGPICSFGGAKFGRGATLDY